MPVATIRPIGDGTHAATYDVGVGSHTAPGAAPLTATTSGIYTYVNSGALDETTFGYIGSRTTDTNANPGRLEFTWGAPPSGIVISSIVMVGYMRLASVGGSWWSGDCSVYGMVNPAGTRYAGTTVVLPAAAAVNTNTSGPSGSFGVAQTLGTWATNPATGVAWLLSDLLSGTFKAGVAADSPNIVHSNGGAGSHTWCLAGVEIQINYTVATTMTASSLRVASHALRMRHA